MVPGALMMEVEDFGHEQYIKLCRLGQVETLGVSSV